MGNSIAFLNQGKLLLTFPNESGSSENGALSVWDIARNKLLHGVPGPFPGRNFRYNEARYFAVSRDQSMAAVVSSILPAEPVTISATRDWTRLRTISMNRDPLRPETAT